MTESRADFPILLAIAALGLPALAAAQSDDEQLLDELMAVVDEGTAIATQTRMNVDYVPGMVTVLEGEWAASLGARTVLDALALVPGVLTSLGNAGEPSLLVRGVQFPFNSGNVKVLVNSIAMSRETAGLSSSVMHMPIEQVERIEFVRGPGSVLYGDFAFMGLLNVVTRATGSGAFARAQHDGSATAGGRYGWASQDKATRVSLNATLVRLDEAEVPDAPPNQPAGTAQGPDDRAFATLALQHRGFGADLQLVRREFDRDVGAPDEDDAVVLQLRQALTLAPTLSGSVFLSGLRNDASSPNREFEGDLYEGGGSLEWSGLARHQFVTKATYTLEQIDRTRNQSPPPPPPALPPPAVIRTDLERRYYGIALQDQYSATDRLSLTAGFRYDWREDIDDERFTPRLAVAYRVADAHMLKAQYSEGYRAPTFFELYPAQTGQRDLDLEVVATTELSYINRAPQRVARLTLFRSELDDMTFSRPPGGFGNIAEAEAKGVEAELEQQLTGSLKLLANVSWVDSWSDRNPTGTRQEDGPVAQWLGNVALAWRPVGNLLLATHVNYVGERNEPATNGETRLAVSASWSDVLTHGLSLRLAARNATGEELQSVTMAPTGNSTVRLYDESLYSLTAAYEF